MIIKVSSTNERLFNPDLWGNLEQDKKNQFGVKIRKLSLSVHSDKWMKSFDVENISIDLKEYVKAHVVGLVNAPVLKDEKGAETELTLELLFSDTYAELYEVVESLLKYIQDMYVEDNEEDIKK